MKRNWKHLATVLCLVALCLALMSVTALAAKPLTAQIPVQVELSGTLPQVAEKFQVELTAQEADAPMPAGTKDGVYIMTLTGESAGELVLSFDKLGEYHYTVRQLPGTNEDCYQDESVYHITAQVTNNAAYDGFNLSMAIRRNEEAQKRETIVFENRYANPNSVQIQAQKLMDGGMPKTGAFSFELVDAAGKVIQTVTNQGKAVTFDAISYNKAGTYTYTIREVPGKVTGIVYDETVYTAQVTVSKDDVGDYQTQLVYRKGEEQLENVPVFQNTAKPVTARLQAQKLMDGQTPATGVFSFELVDAAGKVIQSVTNQGKAVTFDAISYDKGGTYTYTLREVPGKLTGIVYDETVYTAQVVVEKDENDALQTKVTYLLQDQALETVPLFQNYAKPVTAQLRAQKLMDGETPPNGAFSFELLNAAGKKVQTVVNADKEVIFDAISLDAPGVYTYTIREIPGKNKGLVYDQTEYTAQVTVSRDKNGALQAEVKYLLQDQVLERVPVFQNKAKPVVGEIHAYKTLDGKKPKNDAFSFELVDAEGKVLQTVTNKGKNVKFQEMTYDKEGTYTYTMREIPGEDADIIYDSTVYTAKVEVTRQEDGTLRAATTYLRGEKILEEAPTFKNKTKAPTPQTGDNFNMVLVVTVMAVCLAAIVILVLVMRKRKKA